MTTLVKTAEYGLMVIFSLTIIFHFFVLSGIVPSDIIWGGRVTNPAEIYVFEGVSIGINLLFLVVVLIRIGVIKPQPPKYFLPVAFWIMSVVFLLNTIGNLLAVNKTEMLIFTPITLVLFIFSTILALTKSQTQIGSKS